jgi:hypothetical protein
MAFMAARARSTMAVISGLGSGFGSSFLSAAGGAGAVAVWFMTPKLEGAYLNAWTTWKNSLFYRINERKADFIARKEA